LKRFSFIEQAVFTAFLICRNCALQCKMFGRAFFMQEKSAPIAVQILI